MTEKIMRETQSKASSETADYKHLTRLPEVAWPTLALWLGASMAWGLSTVLALSGTISITTGMVFNTISAYLLFTPMHDASHRAVSTHRWVNEVIGRLSMLALFGPFPAFRYVHLRHHAHTNEAHEDPDHWAGRGPNWALPLRWLTQDAYYYYFYVRRWSEHPKPERWETVVTLVGLFAVLGVLIANGSAVFALLLWFIPGRLAIAFLAFAFDYLPHKPHTTTSREDRFKATLVRPVGILTPGLVYQNYHLIHHLYPGVPFYRYARIWFARREFFRSKGVVERYLFKQTKE